MAARPVGVGKACGGGLVGCLNVVSGSLLSQSQSEYQRQVVKMIMGELSRMREYRVYKQTREVASISAGKRPRPISRKASDAVPTVKITMLSPSPGSPGHFSAAEAYWKKGITCYYLDESLIGAVSQFFSLNFSSLRIPGNTL